LIDDDDDARREGWARDATRRDAERAPFRSVLHTRDDDER
jgi:hypothetical protein